MKGVNLAKQKNIMDSYVIRIYRRTKDDTKSLIGIVEHIGVEGRMAFHNIEELWTILNLESCNTQE